MADEHKLRRQAERARRAQDIMEDELVQEAFAELEKTIDTAWKTSIGDEREQRENAYIMYRLLQQFRSHFGQIINTGEHARKQLLELKDPSKLRRMMTNG